MSLTSKLDINVKYPKICASIISIILITTGLWCYFNYSNILFIHLKNVRSNKDVVILLLLCIVVVVVVIE